VTIVSIKDNDILVGIAGLIGSGKDTAADYLCTVHGFKRISFASALKEAVSVIFGWEYELLEGSTKTSREWREQVDEWWATRLDIPHLTPRWVLQQWGTELARKSFHDDIWIASVENKLRSNSDDIVITDCRFSNELQAIKNAGGITVRTHRGEEPEWLNIAGLLNITQNSNVQEECREMLHKLNIHASEYSSVGLEYDFHLNNDGTIDDLHKQIESIING